MSAILVNTTGFRSSNESAEHLHIEQIQSEVHHKCVVGGISSTLWPLDPHALDRGAEVSCEVGPCHFQN